MSVVIPVYNVGPYLRECLDSVLGQTIGSDRLEVVAVDDGSTDGSGDILDSYARRHPNVRVFHEPNSGGPGRPRNIGLDHAIGSYVFLMDADDYFGREALARMVAMAERNRSDVVYGKMVGVAGRRAGVHAFRRTRNRARLTDVYDTLNVMKLFRRSLIERVGVRFDETVEGGEDSPFTAELLLAASVVSVVADYDCYYYRNRPGSVTKRVRTEDPADYLVRMSRRAELLASHKPPGRERDRLMTRHIRDLVRPFNGRWLGLPADDRHRVFEVGARLLDEWSNPHIQQLLAPPHALRVYCLRHGLMNALEDIVAAPRWGSGQAVVDRGRAYLNLPHFRDEHGIPDSCFEITDKAAPHRRIDRAEVIDDRLVLSGIAYLSRVGGDTTIVLRRWPWGVAHRFPADRLPSPEVRDRHTSYPQAGLRCEIDLNQAIGGRRLPAGCWRVSLEIGAPTLRREVSARLTKRLAHRTPRLRRLDRTRTSIYRAADRSLRVQMPGGRGVRTALELIADSAGRMLRGRGSFPVRVLRRIARRARF